MTNEDKLLLIKDLSARLPYGVQIEHIKSGMRSFLHELKVYPMYDDNDNVFDCICHTDFFGDGDSFDISEFKPYLFPLSSMTEEQKKEYTYIVNYISLDDTINWKEGEFIYVDQITRLINFFYLNHIDFRDLIPKDLALDATGKNIY